MGTFLAIIWQESNLSYVQNSFPERTENGLIRTADDASYLQPPINWKETGTWKDKSKGSSSYFQRPPGYGIVFLFSSYLSPSNPYLILKIIQVLGFFISIFIISRLLTLFGLNEKWALLGTSIFALLPSFSGFLYHSLTEGITPVLLLWSTFEWILILRNKGNKYRWICSNAFLLLVRPQLSIFVLVLMFFLLMKRQFKTFAWGLIIILPFSIWQVRNVSIAGWSGMHPIYSVDNQSFYRPPHEALGNLFKIWEFKSDRFHETVALLQFDTSDEARSKALNDIPEKYREDVDPILKEYQEVCRLQIEHITNEYLSYELAEEKAFVIHVNAKTVELANSNFVDAYIKTPIGSARELFVNSHLHLTIFQLKYRGAIWMEALRWSCLLVTLIGIGSLFGLSVFWKNVPKELWLICLASVITILYLVFVQRLNEERYLTPILPLAFIASIWLVNSWVQRINK